MQPKAVVKQRAENTRISGQRSAAVVPRGRLLKSAESSQSFISTHMHYVAVVGPGTVFPSDGTSRRLADVTDGPANTLMVVEVVNAGIHWMEPKELDWETMSVSLNDRTRPSVSSNHAFTGSGSAGPHVVTLDDMVSDLPKELSAETLKALLTVGGGERIERERWRSPR